MLPASKPTNPKIDAPVKVWLGANSNSEERVPALATPVLEVEPAPDHHLLRECVGGDEAAWRRLHRRSYPVAAAFLKKLGVRERDLEDAAQELFVEVFRYLPTFRGEAEFKTWLYRLCITQARRVRRRARISETLRTLLAMAPEEGLVSSPSLSEGAARSRIEGALSHLSDAERAVFVLYEMENVPGKQIAEIVGCPEATVWRRLHYARRGFKRALGVGEESAGK
jgi:RNA polymerase sigma-70 factor (ECF subfamily)